MKLKDKIKVVRDNKKEKFKITLHIERVIKFNDMSKYKTDKDIKNDLIEKIIDSDEIQNRLNYLLCYYKNNIHYWRSVVASIETINDVMELKMRAIKLLEEEAQK